VRVDLPAQVEEEALADPRGDVLVAERRKRTGEREAEVRHGDRHERRQILGDEHVVDDELEEVDLDRVDRRDEEQQEQPEGDPAPVGPRERPEAPHDLRRRDRRGLVHDARVVRGGAQEGRDAIAQGHGGGRDVRGETCERPAGGAGRSGEALSRAYVLELRRARRRLRRRRLRRREGPELELLAADALKRAAGVVFVNRMARRSPDPVRRP
jgi:hypothetical protein